MIVWIISIGLLSPHVYWSDFIVAADLTCVLMILAVLMVGKLTDADRKWRIILFSFCCLFIAAGITFSVLTTVCEIPKYGKFAVPSSKSWCSIMFFNIAFLVLSIILWCSAMFVVSYR
ncbi:unnamed protein product [Schistosoma turkestanicum]|nr:unnamed protein product [Schistosoma turkestanicum]